jgi:dipeptidyl aminopeptidase/acylaminoacyl peptidase
MIDLLKSVLPGVNKAVEMGVADPEKLGVMGHSFGGYSTLSLIVQTTRFRAAISQAGASDLISIYGEMDQAGNTFGTGWLEDGQARMGGTPWQFRDRYIENSPVFYLDRIQTPLLIMHGTTDTAVSPSQADEVFVGLQRLGKEVVYVKYSGEGHGITRYLNQLDYCNRMIDWFNVHLKSAHSSLRQ